MLESVSFPRGVFSTNFLAVAGLGRRSPYSHVLTVRGFSPHSSAALSTPTLRMNAGRVIMLENFPRFAEIMQAPSFFSFPRNVEPAKNQTLILSPMDFKEEIGRRIKEARKEKGWTLEQLSRETRDVLSFQRIGAYESGDRMPGPAEAVILAKALQVRPAYLLAVEDTQIPLSAQEEELVKNWRTLNERDRMAFFRQVEMAALQNRDPAPSQKVKATFGRPREDHEKDSAPRGAVRRLRGS